MKIKNATMTNTALMGILVGLAGIEHGVGEILQGSAAPKGLMIQSWPDSAAMKIVNGEPALTIIPNLLVTGILAILFSLIFIAWALLGARRKHCGLALILVCIPMLVCGAGFGPPILGAILGAAAARRPAISNERRALLPDGLGRAWPWALGLCMLNWLAMMPGAVLLNYYWGINSAALASVLLLGMFVFLFLTILTASVRDTATAAG